MTAENENESVKVGDVVQLRSGKVRWNVEAVCRDGEGVLRADLLAEKTDSFARGALVADLTVLPGEVL